MEQKLVFPTALALLLLASTAKSLMLDVSKYAKGNHDITQALLTAFKEACASTSPSKIWIPKSKFVLCEVTLSGPCKGPIELQVDGELTAPADSHQIKSEGWVSFSYLDHFTLSGSGTFDGQGKNAWAKSTCNKNVNCAQNPTNLRFNFLTNVLVKGITSQDSKEFHMNILGCKNMKIQHVTISTPGDSPNTDGIHIGRSSGITITDTKIQTGDDCISMGDGSQQITIARVTCGPGHGISVGSLGKYQNEQPVFGIRVTDCTLTNTQNGVRIKTWPGSPAGSAKDMHFENIIMKNVSNPILIDQGYCPWGQCKVQSPSQIKLSNISFKTIRGSSATQLAVNLICSSHTPCDSVELTNIDLEYHGPEGPAISTCNHVKPKISGMQNPKICANTKASAQPK